MKKIITSMTAFVCAMVASLAFFCTHVNANTILMQQEVGKTSFSNDWEKRSILYLNDGTVVGLLKYGFDTVWIDEDYAYGKSYEAYATSSIYRAGYDKDYVSDDGRRGIGVFSETERAHKTDDVSYKLDITASFLISTVIHIL